MPRAAKAVGDQAPKRSSARKSKKTVDLPNARTNGALFAAPAEPSDVSTSTPLITFSDSDNGTTTSEEGGSDMPTESTTTQIEQGQATLDAAKTAADAAAAAAAANPTDTALAETAAKAAQISDAISSLVTAPVELTPEEQIELAKRHRRMEAGLGVVAAITGALYALHQVLTDGKFQDLLNKDLPASVKTAMTNGINTALTKLNPLFEGFRKFQDKDLRDKSNNLLDASVEIAYALVELSEPENQESARKSADNIALTMGLVKKGAPLVIACIDMIACCMSALGDNKKSTLTAETKDLGEKLNKALKAKTAKRQADYAKNVDAGMKLLAAQKGYVLTTGGTA